MNEDKVSGQLVRERIERAKLDLGILSNQISSIKSTKGVPMSFPENVQSIGGVIAIVVVLIGVLMCLSVVPVSPVVVGACLAGLGVARLT